MKKLFKNNASKFMFFTICFLLVSQLSNAQSIEDSKTIEKEFSGKTIVALNHSYGPVKVHRSTSNSVRIVARMAVKGTDQGDINKVLAQFVVDVEEFNSRLDIKSKLNITNWSSNNRRIKIKFKDGTKVSKIKDIKVYVDLYIPKLEELVVKNKYDNIYIDDIDSNLEVELYTGELELGNVKGNVALKFKYSKAKLGTIVDGDFDLYDSKINLKAARNLKLRSKYSDGFIGPTQNLELRTYDDDYEIDNINNELLIEDKYSEFDFRSFASAKMDVYDADIKMMNTKSLIVNSKYSEFKIDAVDYLDFSKSYDDDWTIGELGEMEGESKYTVFKIKACRKGINIETYDDDIKVRKVLPSFGHLKMSGKYTELEFPIPDEVVYQLDAQLQHGKLQFPESRFDVQIYKEKSSTTEVKGKTRGAVECSPKVEMDVYDCKVDLEY